MGREEEVCCPYLDLHLDLQVSPVDGEQRAVRAGGAQLPGAVGHVPVAVSQEDQRGEGGDLAGEGALLCRRGQGEGLHFICTPTQPHHTTQPPLTSVAAHPYPLTPHSHFVNGVSSCFTHTAPLLLDHRHPTPTPPIHPPSLPFIHQGRGAFILGFHLHTPHTSLPHFVNVCCLHCTPLLHGPKAPHPQPHPPMLTSTPSTLLVVQYWCSGSQRATLGYEWNRKSLGTLRTSSG